MMQRDLGDIIHRQLQLWPLTVNIAMLGKLAMRLKQVVRYRVLFLQAMEWAPVCGAAGLFRIRVE